MADLAFLGGSAVEVAPLLLGARLTVGETAIVITEVEAYLADKDPGSHAYRGPGRRNAVMFGPSGRLYTYFTYGMHTCANVVCAPAGTAAAVLLRAGRVVTGIDVARERRSTSRDDSDLASGPARLCVAMGITLADGGVDLMTGRVRLDPPAVAISSTRIGSGPRVGVSGDGGTATFPWRFWLIGDPTVSRYRAAASRRRG